MARPFPYLLYSGLSRKSDRHRADRLDRLVQNGALSHAARDQRLAQNLPDRPKGEVLWLHAATGFALRPTMELLCRIGDDRPDMFGLITLSPDVQPPAGAALDSGHFTLLPEDDSTIVRRFLDHWSPDSLVWIGGKFRPNLLRETHERHIPTLAIEAPHSPTTLDLTSPVPGLRRHVLGGFDHVITASSEAAYPWRRAGLGTEQIEILGYLEEGGIAPSVDEDELTRRMVEIGTRPTWFAARLDRSEISEVIRAHKRALRRAHRLLLVLSLSDPSTQDSVLAQMETAGLAATILNPDSPISESDQVVILPTAPHQGEEGLWHRIAPISFMGSSLGPFGGIDPYPAAAMGSAILHGRHVSDFTTAYARLTAGNAVRAVTDGFELGEEVGRLMSPDQAALMAGAAWEVASTGAEVTDRVANLVQDFLDLRERIAP